MLEEVEEPDQGQAHRRQLPVDGAPQQEDQGQTLRTRVSHFLGRFGCASFSRATWSPVSEFTNKNAQIC